MKLKYKKRILFAILSMLVVFSCTACNSNGKDGKQEEKVEGNNQEKKVSFDDYMDQLLSQDLASDLMVYHQFVENPDSFNITEYSHKISGPSKESFDEETKLCKERLEKLLSYDYESLNDEQKLDYDTLRTYYEQRIEIEDCCYYQEPLSTTDGDHIIIPGIMGLQASRFFETLNNRNLKDKTSVEEYFVFYEAIGDYLKEIAQFEREKYDAGLFMPALRAGKVIDVCKEKIDNQCVEVTESFEEELKKLDWLSEADKADLLAQNEAKVKEHIVPGYQAIADAMKDCAKDNNQGKALCETELGKKYYSYLIKAENNMNWTPEEMIEVLDKYVDAWNEERDGIIAANPGIAVAISKKLSNYSDIDTLITALNEGAKKDFPALNIEWGIKDMPESMNGFAMGLFYPQALDTMTKNHFIYAGTLLSPGESDYAETVAHEGVPGHLYNYCYWMQLDMSPYRRFISWLKSIGTLEGWTTYIEEFGYRYIGLNDVEARYLELERLRELAAIQRVDAGVNYEGWKLKEVVDYLLKNASEYALAGEYIVDVVQDSINMYGPYGLGYINLTEIKADMMEKKGDSYTDLDFHTDYLNVGPTNFEFIREQLLGNS